MSNSVFSLSAAALAAAIVISLAPAAQARPVLVCDDDGCSPGIIVPTPVVIVTDDCCDCD